MLSKLTMGMKLEKIIDYNMTDAEAGAYKIALIYEEEYRKAFTELNLGGQNYRKNSLPKNGDPRKCNLFKFCWKLRRELKGLISSDKYRLYIYSNFFVLKKYYLEGDKKGKVHIEPNAICGPKAWIRYKVYENLLRRKSEEIANRKPIVPLDEITNKSMKEIMLFKKFIFEKCDGKPTIEKIKKFVDNGFFKMWVMGQLVSKIYLVLSPWIKSLVDEPEQKFNFSKGLVEEKITDEVIKYFQHEFDYEHN